MEGIWKGIIGGISGAIVNGVATAIANKQMTDAYNTSSKQLQQANEEYSGQKSFDRANQAAIAEGLEQQNLAQDLAASVSPTSNSRIGNANMSIDTVNNNNQFNQGYNAEYNRNRQNDRQMIANTKTDIDNKLKQAEVNSGVTRQAGQSILNTAASGLDLYNQLRRSKEAEE